MLLGHSLLSDLSISRGGHAHTLQKNMSRPTSLPLYICNKIEREERGYVWPFNNENHKSK